jgi:ATP-dependent Clp protease protease subunit
MIIQNRLARLFALNANAPRDYKIVLAEAANEASVYLYDVIGQDWWSGGGVTSKQFSKDLLALGNKTLHLHVNSPGGDVFEGRAMVAALQAYPGEVIAHIDGLAASAASFLVMHADQIIMTEGSFMMIHNGWTMAMGDRHAMTNTAALLAKIDGSITDDYLTHVSNTREEVGAWMDAETWFTAAEALDAGLCTSIAEGRKDGKSARARNWNLSAYDHPPADLAPVVEPTDPAPTPEPEPGHTAAHAARMRALAMTDMQLA